MFTGYVTDQDELAELYHNAFAYLHGHEFGGTNPTMLKAMAYGSCILALNTRFNQEMLQGGKFGLFFEKTEESIAAVIQKIEKHPTLAGEMKGSSRDGIGERYNWDYVTNRYIRIFEQLK